MGTYKLSERTLPIDDTWDVIVVGGGPAGAAAAAAAAREGAKTLLLEATGALGGMGTSGMVPAWCPFSDKKQMVYRGLAEKVFTQCTAGMPHVPPTQLDWTPIDPEWLKRVYDQLVTDAGARVLFHTVLAAVETDGAGAVDALIVVNKAGLSACSAKVYVDCTGDADLAAWAGAEYQKGDPETGDLQPATHCFALANVDMYGYAHCGRIRHGSDKPVIDDIIASGKYPLITDRHVCNNVVGPGTVGFNAGHIWHVDNTDPASVSDALIKGRQIALAFQQAMAEFFPKAFGNAWLSATASLLGIRETRRIVGDYLLTLDDYLDRRSFDDEICRNCYYIDIHLSVDETKLDKQGKIDHAKRDLHYGPGESHGIPYRCLTPKGLRNVLVAGRSISTDRAVQGSTRVMPVCLAMGEAAGMAAAHAAESRNPDVHAVDLSRLRTRLKQEGAYLPDPAP